MADNNYNPQLDSPINDLPSQEEIGEKPYYDNDSAPTALNPVDNTQTQLEKPNDDIQIQNKDPQFSTTDDDMFQHENKDIKYSPNCKRQCCKNIRLIICSIFLFIIFLTDLVFHILIEFNPILLIDDIALLVIAIILNYISFKWECVYNKKLGLIILIYAVLGLGLRYFGLSQYKNKMFDTLFPMHFAFLIVRMLAIFISLPPIINPPQYV